MNQSANNHADDPDRGLVTALSIDTKRHQVLRRLLNSLLLCYVLLFPVAGYTIGLVFGNPKTNSIAATSAMGFAIISLLMFFGMPLLAMTTRHFAIRLSRNKPRILVLTMAHLFGFFGIGAAYAIWALLIPEAASRYFVFVMPGLTIVATILSFAGSIIGERIGIRLIRSNM